MEVIKLLAERCCRVAKSVRLAGPSRKAFFPVSEPHPIHSSTFTETSWSESRLNTRAWTPWRSSVCVCVCVCVCAVTVCQAEQMGLQHRGL